MCCVQSKTPIAHSTEVVFVFFFFVGFDTYKQEISIFQNNKERNEENNKNGNDLQRAQVKQLLWYVFPRAVTTSPSTNRPQ